MRDLHAGTLAEVDELLAADAGRASALSEDDRVTADVLRFMCQSAIEVEDSGWPLLGSIDHMEGPPMALTYAAQEQRADTPERLQRWLARLAAYPTFIDAHIERIREARRQGIVPARIVAERFADQLARRLAEPPEASPVVTTPPVAAESDRDAIAAAVREYVQPADARLLAATRQVLPEARAEPGLSALPGGDRIYEAVRFQWTTLRTEPEELHRFGLADLDGIEAERRAIARVAGFGEDSAAYRDSLATEASNRPRTAEELLARMRDDLARALAVTPAWFGRQPRATCRVEPLDAALETDSFGYYLSPTPDGSRPGVFYMNTNELATKLFSRFATVTYHETIPGHHLQLATEAELPRLSAFRRLGAREACGAYLEGWALYTERLADEMGLFRNEAERFGMLDGQAWRAARLVIDTGVHAFGWQRDRAVGFLIESAGFDRSDAEIEVDRYVAMPGQALAYKVGQRAIEQLRSAVMGAGDGAGRPSAVRDFHDAVLGHGSLPLEVLQASVPRWLAAATPASATTAVSAGSPIRPE
jgi:uncharacterized protein (DUF885 family)